MSNDYIHYIKREVIINYTEDLNSPFFAELQNYDSGFDSPNFHVTKSKSWPIDEIKEDDVIWLIGQLSSRWGRLPPSLDAKIVVGEVNEISIGENKTKIRFGAKSGSIWFPLVDASEILSQLPVELKNGTTKEVYSPIKDNLGQAFQSIKKVHDASVLHQWESEVLNKDMEFISYRIADGTKSAFLKVENQVRKGGSVFWDRWSLPRRLSERRELVSDEVLDKLLSEKIYKSSLVWGIESKKYNEVGSYSSKEKKLAVSLGKYEASIIE